MKRITIAVLVSAVLVAPALAQQQAGKPAAAPAQAQSAPQAAAPPKLVQSVPAAAPAKTSRRHEDARHCLEKSTNGEIIKCAEQYL